MFIKCKMNQRLLLRILNTFLWMKLFWAEQPKASKKKPSKELSNRFKARALKNNTKYFSGCQNQRQHLSLKCWYFIFITILYNCSFACFWSLICVYFLLTILSFCNNCIQCHKQIKYQVSRQRFSSPFRFYFS